MNKISLPLDAEHQLRVLSRVEPGCLGPDGRLLVEDFCAFAQTKFDVFKPDFCRVTLVARFDKSLPEVQYSLNGKLLDEDKTRKFLHLLGVDFDDFEHELNMDLANLIDRYLGR
jgi:hypothetical protein